MNASVSRVLELRCVPPCPTYSTSLFHPRQELTMEPRLALNLWLSPASTSQVPGLQTGATTPSFVLLLLLTPHQHLCMRGTVPVCVAVGICACRYMQKPEADGRGQCSPPYLLRQILSPNMELTELSSWMANELQGSAHLWSTNTGGCTHMLLYPAFIWQSLGIRQAKPSPQPPIFLDSK